MAYEINKEFRSAVKALGFDVLYSSMGIIKQDVMDKYLGKAPLACMSRDLLLKSIGYCNVFAKLGLLFDGTPIIYSNANKWFLNDYMRCVGIFYVPESVYLFYRDARKGYITDTYVLQLDVDSYRGSTTLYRMHPLVCMHKQWVFCMLDIFRTKGQVQMAVNYNILREVQLEDMDLVAQMYKLDVVDKIPNSEGLFYDGEYAFVYES